MREYMAYHSVAFQIKIFCLCSGFYLSCVDKQLDTSSIYMNKCGRKTWCIYCPFDSIINKNLKFCERTHIRMDQKEEIYLLFSNLHWQRAL